MPVRDVNEAVVLTIRFPTITAGLRAVIRALDNHSAVLV
jgi:hypothetical protein